MSDREDLYKKFGPKLIEAIVLIIKDEINILRGKAGLVERTNAQMITAIYNKLDSLGQYDFMSHDIEK